GIGRVEEEEDLDEATAAAAARLGVEPPASSPEESPRFPEPRDTRNHAREGDGDDLGRRDGDGGDGMLSATRPDTPPAPASAPDDAEATQPALPASTAATTQPDPALPVPETPQRERDHTGPEAPENAVEGQDKAGDADATKRLEPVGNASSKAGPAKPAGAKDDKGQPQPDPGRPEPAPDLQWPGLSDDGGA